MLRDWDMSERSDGKKYKATDMVRLGCGDCAGCSECCRVAGDTIVLDPYDVYHLCRYTGQSLEKMLGVSVSLGVVDGIVLPHLQLPDDKSGCYYLDMQGRCSIYEARPGICRLFPLGRIYEEGVFSYFLQVDECKKPNRTKVKISKWLGIPDLPAYEQFVNDWHWYIRQLSQEAACCHEEEKLRQLSMRVLQIFYMTPYDLEQPFYQQYHARRRLCAEQGTR